MTTLPPSRIHLALTRSPADSVDPMTSAERYARKDLIFQSQSSVSILSVANLNGYPVLFCIMPCSVSMYFTIVYPDVCTQCDSEPDRYLFLTHLQVEVRMRTEMSMGLLRQVSTIG